MLKEGACLIANIRCIVPFQAIQLYLFFNVSAKGTYTAPSETDALEHEKLDLAAEHELKCLRLVCFYHGKIPSDKSG